MTSWIVILFALVGIFVANSIPFIPHSWTDGVRTFLGLLVVILVLWNLWPHLNRPMKVGGAVVLGVSGVWIVDKVPLVSSLLPGSSKMALQVVIGAVALFLAVSNLRAVKEAED